MPELPESKARPHPWQQHRRRLFSEAATHAHASRPRSGEHRSTKTLYAELQVASNFSFLRGASHADELIATAARLGLHALAVTDRHTLAGIVRAHVAAKEHGVRLVVGAEVEIMGDDRTERRRDEAKEPRLDVGEQSAASLRLSASPSPPCRLLLYPTSLAAYGRLCRLLTVGKRRASKGECDLTLEDVITHQEGLLAVVVPAASLDERFHDQLHRLRESFDDDRLSVAASRSFGADDAGRLRTIADMARSADLPLVATNDVCYHAPTRRALHDVLTCVRHGCTLDTAGMRLNPNAERHLKSPEEMARLFAEYPEAIARSVAIAERCAGFSLDQVRYIYPREVCPPGKSAMAYLAELTWSGARQRYAKSVEAERSDDSVPHRIGGQLRHELQLIEELGIPQYFLTVCDIVTFARSRGILCQGRGAAANSAVCYCLGITSVDPNRIDVLFERFVSRARHEPPDIDIDFEHERREEVIQYIYRKYGRERAALTAEVISYRGRSAIRDVGKALGLSLDCVDRLAKQLDWWDKGSINPERLRELGYDPQDPTMRRLAALVEQLLGFPRHLSQHVGGFVITDGPLCELVPIENAAMEDRTVIEWDKDDIEAMGMMKVDCLGLGMLTCLNRCFNLLAEYDGTSRDGETERRSRIGLHSVCPSLLPVPSCLPGTRYCLDLASIPPEDPATYDMICRADTVGVFQIESRAQMSMLPRLRPRCFYDLVIEVAIVRPGPIVGDMVHPYLKRRNGEEPVIFPDEKVKKVLGKTLGVPLFQEQAMALAIEAAGFTAEEADRLRRAIAAWKSKSKVIFEFGRRIIDGMVRRGYDRGFAERCFEQMKGFSEYGFPESHAASFALIVYASAWLKCHHPAAFAAALINSQPMGFYAPAQIVRDVRAHGVVVRPIDVNHSGWDCSLERHEDATFQGQAIPAMRLGMRLVKGLRQADAQAVADAVKRQGPFDSVEALWRGSGVAVSAMKRLAAADAFGSMGLDRQSALWQIRAMKDERLPMFEHASRGVDRDGGEGERKGEGLPVVGISRQVVHDYASTGLSLKRHPVSFLRPMLQEMGVSTCEALADEFRWRHGRSIAVAGLVLVRQRPSTASGVVFMTIEDETGTANLIFRPGVFERFRRAARHGMLLLIRGKVERQAGVVHVMVRGVEDLTDELTGLRDNSRNFR